MYSRNWHDIVFRSVEVGVALWFPCCLWNSMAPEQLWILNPRKLLRRQIDPVASTSTEKVNVFHASFLLLFIDLNGYLFGSLKHLLKKDNRFYQTKTVGFATIQRSPSL